jgi:hypothetical protein
VVDGWRTSVRIGHCVIHCLCTDLGPYMIQSDRCMTNQEEHTLVVCGQCAHHDSASSQRAHRSTHTCTTRTPQTTKRYADAHMQRGSDRAGMRLWQIYPHMHAHTHTHQAGCSVTMPHTCSLSLIQTVNCRCRHVSAHVDTQHSQLRLEVVGGPI